MGPVSLLTDVWPLLILLSVLPLMWRQGAHRWEFWRRSTDPMLSIWGQPLPAAPQGLPHVLLHREGPLGEVVLPKSPEKPLFWLIPVIERLGSLNKAQNHMECSSQHIFGFPFKKKLVLKAFCSQLCGGQQPLLPSTSEHLGASILVGRKQQNHANLIFPLIPHISYMLASLFIAPDIIPLVRFYAWSHLGQF